MAQKEAAALRMWRSEAFWGVLGVVTLHSDRSCPGTPELLCSTAGTGPAGKNSASVGQTNHAELW